jgi:hypothetical protein
MSHITQIALEINDLNSLQTAVKALGLNFNEGQKQHKYFANQRGTCDHAISVPGNKEAYEIGVVQDGSNYKLQWDSFAGGKGLVQYVGQGANKLKQEYAVSVAEKQARRDGYRVKRENVGGKIRLRITN